MRRGSSKDTQIFLDDFVIYRLCRLYRFWSSRIIFVDISDNNIGANVRLLFLELYKKHSDIAEEACIWGVNLMIVDGI
jgi:hypothetical protein